MGIFTKADESIGVALMLEEIRGVRTDVARVNDKVSEVSETVTEYQKDVDLLSTSVGDMKSDVSTLKKDVFEIKKEREIEANRWAGPRKLIGNVTLVAGGLGGLGLILEWANVISILP